RDCHLAHARSHERVRGGAGVAQRDGGAMVGPCVLPPAAVPAPCDRREFAPRLWVRRPDGGNRTPRQGALRASVATHRRVLPFSLAFGGAQTRADKCRES